MGGSYACIGGEDMWYVYGGQRCMYNCCALSISISILFSIAKHIAAAMSEFVRRIREAAGGAEGGEEEGEAGEGGEGGAVGDYAAVMAHLRGLGPSAIDAELRSIALAAPDAANLSEVSGQ
jgi:hypothetical protein